MINTSVVITLIGRPNVGKSTLFNRLMGQQFKAITYDLPGVTRDRHYGIMNLDDVTAILVDTGGFYPTTVEASGNTLQEKQFTTFFNIMADQAKLAINESDLVLLVVDGREGVNPFDQKIAEYIRKTKKDFWVLVNKMDSTKQDGLQFEFYQLGIDEENLKTLSSAHGTGVEQLKSDLSKIIQEKNALKESEITGGVTPKSEVVGSVAIIGAPNAGKSTLLNRLVGAKRALVSDIPGTTVDPIEGYMELNFGEDVDFLLKKENSLYDNLSELSEEETEEERSDNSELVFEDEKNATEEYLFKNNNELEETIFEENYDENSTPEIASPDFESKSYWKSIKLVDTAGIRRQKAVDGFVESQSVIRSLKCIAEADVVIYMVDSTIGITHQDRRLCDIAIEKGKSIILCFNKIDLLKVNFQDRKKRKEWIEEIRFKIPWLDFCEIITISAARGGHINHLKMIMAKTILIRHKKLGTGELNRAIVELVDRNPIVVKNTRGTRLKVKYASMIKTDPPTILIFSNKSKNIPMNFRRYLQNGLRTQFSLMNTPIHLIFRTSTDLENRVKDMEKKSPV